MAIKNYLKDVKEITAPLNWKSSPDSPPTQLAYVTKPEIDLLVKANLHGSMDGKPNKGPKGIISLDGFGVDDEDSVVSQAQQQQFNQNLQNLQESGQQGQYQVNTSQSSFDQPGAVIPTVFQQQNQMEQDQDKPIPGVSFGDQMGVTLTPEQANQIKEEKEKEVTPKNKVKAKVKKLGDWFDKNVFGEPIETLDAKKRKEVLDKLKEFQKLDVGLFKSFMLNRGNAIAGLFGKDQTYSDMEGNIINPKNVFENPTGEGGLMGLNEDGEYVDVRYTKEGFSDLMEETFGKGIFQTLERYEPQAYYPYAGMPQTSGGLLNLADNAALKTSPDGKGYITPDGNFVSKEEGEKYNNMIFAARAELDRMGKNYLTGNPQGGGGGQGIMGIAPPPTDAAVPRPPGSRPPSYPIFGPQPPFTPGPIPFPLPGPGRPPFGRPPYGDKFERPRPYNYFAQSPQYIFGGVPSLNTDAFNEELRKRFGMA